MGNKSLAPVCGVGTAVFSLNGKKIMVRNCLHVPALRNPLYSLRSHLLQKGCGFIGDADMGDYAQPRVSARHVAIVDNAATSSSPPLLHVIPPDTQPPSDSVPRSMSDLAPDEIKQRIPLVDKPVSAAPRLLSTISTTDILRLVHHPDTSPHPIRPCDTPNGSDTKTHWSAEELHRITGCRRFKNYIHLLQTSRDGVWTDSGEFRLALGSYATIPKAKRGTPIDRTRYRYLDIVHVDIGFGDGVALGGTMYALVFADRATRYTWVFGLRWLSPQDIIAAFNQFRSEAGRLAKCFRCDCDEKLFGTAIRAYLQDKDSNIIAAPAGRLSSNGLVESHWKVMVHMSRAYLTEKQMPRHFWFHSISHAARMMNMIPGKFHGKLASPFMLVHGEKADQRTWIPIFSVCYFHHNKDGSCVRSKNQAHTMDGIVIGRSTTSNAIRVYNPRNKQYYEPDSYRIDPFRLPVSVYPTITYDGGLFCSLYRDTTPSFDEPYPPGTRVERVDPHTNILKSGTVMDIPLPSSPSHSGYLIQFDDSTTASISLSEMPDLIPMPPTPS
eukprot:scaffold324_cov188-Alexandrium_tamarense.AAC.2